MSSFKTNRDISCRYIQFENAADYLNDNNIQNDFPFNWIIITHIRLSCFDMYALYNAHCTLTSTYTHKETPLPFANASLGFNAYCVCVCACVAWLSNHFFLSFFLR